MSLKLDWKLLLSDQRPGRGGELSPPSSERQTSGHGRSRFEADYDRVIFSTPFRRLAGKTQVHPFAEVDHVHNRLTHTLEVASVGRSLATEAARFLIERGELEKGSGPGDLAFIVQAACLAHDLGNPPFGHAGEYAIRSWAKQRLKNLLAPLAADEGLRAALVDWHWFEGNAQSYRLVARSEQADVNGYFRFTCASLGALVKYPWCSDDARTAVKEKHNVYGSERAVFERVSEALGLRRADGTVARHPLSYLSEAADDICYRISDFEDAVELGILSEKEVRAIFTQIVGKDEGGTLAALRGRAVSSMIQAAADVFRKDYAAIMAGEREGDLKASFPDAMRDALKQIKTDYERIFGHRRKIAVELGAHNILARLLEVYVSAVVEFKRSKEGEELGFVHRRCFELAGWDKDYLDAHADRDAAWWLGSVRDHVAGMTDAYATQVAREISGV
jgi:dGTPase